MSLGISKPFIVLFLTLAVSTSLAHAETPCVDEKCLADEAEANSQYVKDEDINTFVQDLVRAERFSGARTAAERITPSQSRNALTASIDRHNVEQAIALSQVAAASWEHPHEIASYESLDRVTSISGGRPDDYNIASRYWLLAEKIIEKLEPSLVSLDLEKLLRRRIVRHGQNATLDDLLNTRWPHAIEQLSEHKQGGLWNYVAKIYTELGDYAAATAVLDRAEQRGGYDFQGENRVYVLTTYSWLALKNFDRALKAARQTNPKDTQSLMKLKIAQVLLATGQKDMARETFDEAAADFEKYQDKSRHLALLIEIAQGNLDAGDSGAARRTTDRALEVARLPNLFPAGQLAAAARAYNNIGDHARALDLLHEAVLKLPDPHKVIAFGIVSGPISGSTLGVGDAIRSSIAREFYRAGDQKDFDEQFALLSSWYQNDLQAWRARNTLGSNRPERSPSRDAYLSSLPSDARLGAAMDLAISAITDNEAELARRLLQQALDNFSDTKRPLALTYIAKVAFAGGFSDLMVEALRKAAAAALSIEDKGTRAKTLATVAAFEHELLN